MGNFFDALRSGIQAGVAAYKEGVRHEYSAAGQPIHCPHCRGSSFTPGRALLNSTGRTFLNLDWSDPSAYILACTHCGRMEWFAEEPEEIESE